MIETPRKTWVISKVIVTNPESKILALRRSNTDPAYPLTWDLPGGIVEYGEDPAAAAIRETMEEAGQVVHGLKPTLVASSSSKRGYAVVVTFTAKSESDVVELSYEHDQYQWVTPEQFLELECAPGMRTSVKSLN